ncbi:hypothetical protein ACH5RR_002781 [Cinchona calisaya]|uniref:Uncharacterized protein n=1 Tax=Cinchona calisaya TaxID=153742 RepID=A0ABD3AT12_9GENT
MQSKGLLFAWRKEMLAAMKVFCSIKTLLQQNDQRWRRLLKCFRNTNRMSAQNSVHRDMVNVSSLRIRNPPFKLWRHHPKYIAAVLIFVTDGEGDGFLYALG